MDRASDGLISVEEAISRVLKDILPLNSEQVSISEAFGRVLAIEVASRTTQPPIAVSAMDGYAVRACDVLSVPFSDTIKHTYDCKNDANILCGYIFIKFSKFYCI